MIKLSKDDIFIDSKNENYLYYYGERHSFDPKLKQWEKVKELFTEWKLKTRDHKRISFIESKNIPFAESEISYIEKAGGPGLLTYLSRKNDIEIISPEPNIEYEIDELLNKFSKNEIIYYYTIRTIKQWLRYEIKPDVEEYLIPYLNWIKNNLKLDEYNFKIFKEIHLSIFGFEFNIDDTDFINNSPNPIIEFNQINKVAKECTLIRDRHILETIFKYLDNDYSIFIVYGRNHLLTQRNELKEYFK